ncbi:unnamed protein product [Nezara viridula]|uniref:Methylosome subunit pICln n=1 Tax=Nezara viridula TaxID=85310 RepID=A0A9P0MNT6_NEZVI|nr:unnamed protein product [Nezara viridula]
MVVVTSLPPPSHGVRHEQPSIKAFINDRELGKGTLYIAESHLSWVNSGSGQGFSLEYPHISIHAVSRDRRVYSDDCLYLMIDTDIDFAGRNQNNDQDVNEEESLTELRFVPEDKSCLDAMFSAMSDCQALHPDSQESHSEDEEEDEENGEGEEEGDYDEYLEAEGNGFHSGHREIEMDVDEGQFDDADTPIEE